jgi:cytochrome c oxidase subunit 4
MAEEEHGFHPGASEYIQIGVILAVLTAFEVGLFLFEVDSRLATPVLLVLTVVKFALVVFWFMHLRFDSPIFRRLFVVGLLLAFAVFGVVAATFHFGPI